MSKSIATERAAAYRELVRVHEELVDEAGLSADEPSTTEDIAEVIRGFVRFLVDVVKVDPHR